MVQLRLHIVLAEETARLLEAACLQTGATKTSLVETALVELLEKKSDQRALAAMVKRLDKMSRAIERLAGDASAQTETLALYILYYFCITPPLPESARASSEALGRKRFEYFIAQVGDRLSGKERYGDALLDHMGLEERDSERAAEAMQ